MLRIFSVKSFRIATSAAVQEYSAGDNLCCQSDYQISPELILSAHIVRVVWSFIIQKPLDMELLMAPILGLLSLIYFFLPTRN